MLFRSSFHVSEDGDTRQAAAAPPAGEPESLPRFELPRLFGLDSRRPEQPYPDADWETRFWARTIVPLGDDPLLHASTLTYLSDISSGLTAWHDAAARSGASLDHAVWFHRPARLDDWVLMDLTPLAASGGRGLYTGSIHTRDGRLVASLTQECLFRDPGEHAPS